MSLSALVLLAALSPAAYAEPNADLHLIDALERAPRIAVGTAREVERLPHAGYATRIEVERMLQGKAPVGGSVAVVWEEPVPSAQPRLWPGLRVLATIVPLPTASIWKIRLPDEARRSATEALGGAGDGYLERPNGFELDVLEHYLALDAAARKGDAGVLQLSRMAAKAQPRLARAGLARLSTLPDLDAHIGDAAARALIEALTRGHEGDVGTRALSLVEARRPAKLRAPLSARIEAGAPAILHEALALLEGGMPEERALVMLDSTDPDRRLAAARWARGDAAAARLQDLSRDDPSPAVRAAALRRLQELDSESALPELLDALGDPAPEVRRAAAESLASVGPSAIPALRRTADSESGDSARTAIAALGLLGEPARADLEEIATGHPDEGMRTLAAIALGLPVGHRH